MVTFLFVIHLPQLFKTCGVFLIWLIKEYAIFTVVFRGVCCPVVRTRNNTVVVKNCKFIVFDFVFFVCNQWDASAAEFVG